MFKTISFTFFPTMAFIANAAISKIVVNAAGCILINAGVLPGCAFVYLYQCYNHCCRNNQKGKKTEIVRMTFFKKKFINFFGINCLEQF